MPELGVSTWSLHRELGPMYPGLALTRGEREPDLTFGEGRLTLLDTPAAVADMGVPNLEVCHFHFPRTDPDYLRTLRQRLQEAGVCLLTLLIDAGDITAADPESRRCDTDHIRRWIDIAAKVGAQRARVIAGDAEPDPAGRAVRSSVDGLVELATYARSRAVSVITENWHTLASRPERLLAILDATDGSIGLCADFGNYTRPTKYDDLRAILPSAGSIHAKADFPSPGEMDEADFRRCLDLAHAAGFKGTYVLIFDGPGDEWPSLSRMATVVRPYL